MQTYGMGHWTQRFPQTNGNETVAVGLSHVTNELWIEWSGYPADTLSPFYALSEVLVVPVPVPSLPVVLTRGLAVLLFARWVRLS